MVNINKLRTVFFAKDFPVFFITLTHKEDGSTLQIFDKQPWNIEGSVEANVASQLTPNKHEQVIVKRRYSAFWETKLADRLRELNVKRVFVTGYQARCCVLTTALDAYQSDFVTVVVGDAILDIEAEYYNLCVKFFKDADCLNNTDDIMQELATEHER